ncbi:MAG: glutamate-cysteine ligase family protein [Clostridiaceae bacterium]
MNYRKLNINKLVDYFKKGIKGNVKPTLGVEIEHFIVDEKTGLAAPYEEVARIIEKFSPEGEGLIYEEDNLLGYDCEAYSISLEPASQFEISISPQKTIMEIHKIYKGFLDKLEDILRTTPYAYATLGYQPKSRVEDLTLIPKERYAHMNNHFKSTGTMGINMMRGTGSTQVSIDYYCEEDFVKKFRAASILGPIFSLITDNSPIFQGEVYPLNLLRTHIWNNVDGDRCNVVPCVLNNDFGFEAYARYIYDSPAILLIDKGEVVYTGYKRISEYYAERELTEEEIEHIISMFFPDVRLKSYIEIRMADSMELKYVLSYVTLIKLLFSSWEVLDDLFQYIGDVSLEAIEKGKKELMEKGYQGKIYERSVAQIVDYIMERAIKEADVQEKEYLAPFIKLTEERKTLASMEKEKYINEGFKGIK